MGIRLEELVLDFAANTASLDAAIDRSVAKARSAAGQIDAALGRSYGRKADLNLTPKVDHRHLDALNKHLDVKKKHFDEVQRHLQSSPLRVLVDDSQIKRSIQTARQLKRELNAGTRTRITSGRVHHASDQGDSGLVNSQIGQLLSLVRSLPKQIAKEIKEQTQPGIVGQALGGIGSLLSIPGRILGGVAQAGLTGLAIGATQPISGGVGKGVSQAIEAAIGPKFGSSELVATKLTEAAIASLPAVGKDIGKAVSDTLDKFVPPAVKEKLAERVAPALQDIQQILQLLSEFTDESEKTVAALSQKNKQRLRQKSDKQAAREQATVEQREAFREETKTRVSNKKALADIERQQQDTADALTKYRDLRERVNQISSDPGLEPLKALEFIEYAQNLNNYVADLEEFEQQLSEQQTKLQERLAAAQKKSAAKKATFKSLEPPQPPQALVQVIDALTGGKGISEEEMPEIVADDEKLAGANARAAYTAQGNIIYATSELAAKLDQIRNMTEQEIYDLTHEVEHGIDAAFGSFEGIQAMKQGRVLGEKLTPDESEAAYIGKFTSLYKPEHQAQEQNAELAAMRAAPTLYKQAANQRLQSSIGRKGEIFEQKINNAVTNLIDQFSSIPKTDVLPPEIASQIDTEVKAIKKLLLFLGQTPQIVTQQLQSGKPLEPSEIERIETTIESIANKVVATQERIVAISNQATTTLQSHLLTTAGDLWTGSVGAGNSFDFNLVPPAPSIENPAIDPWGDEALQIPLKKIEPNDLESSNVEVIPEIAVAQSFQIDIPLDISAINIPAEKLIDVETGVLEQIQQSINQDAVNAAVEQAQAIAANFAQAGANAAAGVKSDPGMAQAYAQAIQNTAEQAKADIALVVETLGEEAAFGSRAGNQLAQAKGQVVIAENKAKRAEAMVAQRTASGIATPKQADPRVAPALERVNQLSQVFKSAGSLLTQAIKTDSTEAAAIAHDIRNASGEIRAELDAILGQINTGEIRKAVGLLRTQITKSVNKATSVLGEKGDSIPRNIDELERERFGLGTAGRFIAKYGSTTTGNTDSIAQGSDRLSAALAHLDAVSQTRGLPGVAAEIVTQPLTKDLLVNAAGLAGSQLGGHLGVAPELAGDLVGALLARQGVHVGTTAIAAQQQLVGTAEFESADLFGKLNQVLKKTIELLQSQQVQTGLGKELTGDLLGWGIGNGSAIGLNALGQIHPALSVAAAVPMKGAAVAAAVVPRVQAIIERQAAANTEPDEYERYRLEDDDGGKNLGYLAKEASKAYENLEWTLQSIKKWLPHDAQTPAIASEVEQRMQQFRANTEQLLAVANRVYAGETFNPQILKHLAAAAETQITQFKAYEQQLQAVRKALVASVDAASGSMKSVGVSPTQERLDKTTQTTVQKVEQEIKQLEKSAEGAISQVDQGLRDGLTNIATQVELAQDDLATKLAPLGQQADQTVLETQLSDFATRLNALTERLAKLKAIADAAAASDLENAQPIKVLEARQHSLEDPWVMPIATPSSPVFTSSNTPKFSQIEDPWAEVTQASQQATDSIQANLTTIAQSAEATAQIIKASVGDAIADIDKQSDRDQTGQIQSQIQQPFSVTSQVQEQFENKFLTRWQQFWARVSGATQLNISSGFDLRGLDQIEKKLWQGIVQTLRGAESAADDFDSAFARAQKGVDQSLAASSAAINQQLQDLEDLSATGEESIDLFGKAFGRFSSTIDDVLQSVLALFGIFTLGDAIVNVGQSTFQTALEMERLKTALDFTTEGKATETLSRLTAQADELGVSFRKSSEGYLQLSAALLGTNLQNQTDTLFTGISEAVSTRSLSSEQSERVFLAISQIASKGRVSLEELSQQLGENLPGALNIAARAMGMTTAELVEMVEAGNLTAETFLPKFAAQLSLESKSGLAAAADTAQAKLNRLNNAIERLQAELGGFTLEAAKGGIDATTGAIDLLADNADNLIRVAEVLAIFLGVKLTQALLRLVGGLIAAQFAGLNLIGVLLKLGTAARVAFSAFIVPAAIAAGIEIIFRSFDKGSDDFNQAGKKIESSLERIAAKMEKTADAAKQLGVDLEQSVSKDPVLRGVDKYFTQPIGKPINQFFDRTPIGAIGRVIGEQMTGQKVPRNYTYAEAEKQFILDETQKDFQTNDIVLSKIKIPTPDAAADRLRQIKAIDQELAEKQARLNVLKTEGSGANTAADIAEVEKVIKALQAIREETSLSIFGPKAELQAQIEGLELLKKSYEQYRDSADDPIEKSTAVEKLKEIEARLGRNKELWQQIEAAEKAAGVQVENFRAKVVALDATFTNKLSQNERALTQAQTNILQLQAQGALGENAARQASLQAEADAYNQKLGYLKDYVSAYQAEIGKLSQTDRSQLEQYLGKSLDTAEAGDIAKVEELYKDNLTANQEAALNARKKVLELQGQIDETAGAIATGAIELRNSLRDTEDQAREMQRSVEDFIKSYDDFIRGIIDQTKDAALDIESLKNQIRTNDFKADLLRALTKTSRGIFGTINDVMLRYLDEANQIAQAGLDGTRQQMQLQDQIRGLLQQNQQQGQQSEDIGRQVGRFNEANAGGGVGGVVFPVVGRTATENLPGPGGMMDAMRDGGRRRHNGIDYQYATGTALVAPFSGTVDRIDQHRGEYQVILKGIDEQGRKIQLSMAHLAEIFVEAGQQLTVGQALGKVGGDKGSWGSTGEHLDLKVKVNGQPVDPRNFFAQSGAANTTQVAPPQPQANSFVQKTIQVAQELGISPLDLLSIMSFESAGTFSPKIQGPYVPGQGKGRGLIQFMPATARGLGTSDAALAGMSQQQQLDYVKKYFVSAGITPGMGLGHLYSAVFSGKASNWDKNRGISDGHHTLAGAVERIGREHTPKAQAMLGASVTATASSPTQVNSPSVDLSQGNSAIARLEQTQNEINQLNERIRQQQLEQFGINYNRDITAFIEQRSDAFKQQRLALRELMEQQSDFKQQYQKESIAGTIAQEMTSIERSFRGLRESYEQESISLQKDIAGAEELLKTIPEQIAKLRASSRPEDSILAQGQERVLKDIQDNYAKYQERLQQIRSEHEKLRDEGQAAINFTVGEKLRQATEEGNDALRSLQRSMRDAGQEYADLMEQFQAPTFARELAKALTDVDRSFEGIGDNLGDRNLELTRQIQELEAQLQSTGTELANMVAVGDVNAYALVLLQDQQQAKLAELLAALAQNQTQQAKLPYDQRTARFVKQMQVQRQTGVEREQNLVDTEANYLESRASVIAQRDEYGAAKVEAQAALVRENLRFKVEMEGFDELAARLNYTAEEAATAKQQLTEINSINLENIRQQADLLGKQLREGIGSSFESFFQDLIIGGKSFNEVLGDLIGSMAQFLAQLAAQALVKSLFGGIFGGGGTVGAFAFGGQVRNYAQGGDVMALGMAVTAAMKREGAGAVPIVASVGEEVLSTRNGDAQFYRSLKERGVWNDIKVNNYADGGSVGNFTPAAVVRSPGSRSSNINVPVTVQYQAAAGEDEATSRARAGQLAGQLRAVVQEELVKQTRNGGILNR